jgi:hypothetical protein
MRPKEETLVTEFHNFAPILTRRGGDGGGGGHGRWKETYFELDTTGGQITQDRNHKLVYISLFVRVSFTKFCCCDTLNMDQKIEGGKGSIFLPPYKLESPRCTGAANTEHCLHPSC